MSQKKYSKGTPITIEGVRYKTISDAAEAYNERYDKVIRRLRCGYTPEQAVGLEPFVWYSKQGPIVVEGVKYPSISAAAKKYNIPRATAYYRLNTGRTIEQAFGIEPMTAPDTDKMKTIRRQQKETANGFAGMVINGKFCSSIAEAAREKGLLEGTVYRRLKRGESIEKALEVTPARSRRSGPYEVEGVTYQTITEVSKAYNVRPGSIYKALRSGKTIAQALKLEPAPYKSNAKPVVVEGVKYRSYKEAALAYHVSMSTVRLRIKKGRTIEEIFGIVPIKKTTSKKKSIKVLNVVYPSVAEASAAFNIDRKVVYSRLRSGWDPDDAFTRPVEPRPWLLAENRKNKEKDSTDS